MGQDKSYDPKTIEPKWSEAWKADPTLYKAAEDGLPKFYCLEMLDRKSVV